MANIKLLIAACLFSVSCGSYAGYAQVSPPPSVVGSTVKTGSAGLSWINNAVKFNGSLNIGGRAITVPAAMRFASNAPRIIAFAVAANPYLRFASAIGAWLALGSIRWDDPQQQWVYDEVVPGTKIFWNRPYAENDYIYGSGQSACNGYAIWHNDLQKAVGSGLPDITLTFVPSSNTSGFCVDANGGGMGSVYGMEMPSNQVKTVPLINGDDFANKILANPLPESVPDELPPGIAIPVTDPIINPSADPVPVPQPMRVPMGEPVPVPDSNPQTWKTPVVDIYPSPTIMEPWRVDLRPKDIVKNDPSPITDPAVNPSPSSPNAETEKSPGLCEQFPDILACQKPNLDTPDIDPIQTREADISITPDSGWGADNAVCPNARHLGGANVDFDFSLVCQFMTGIRPVIIAIAWLSAAMIMIGFKRGE